MKHFYTYKGQFYGIRTNYVIFFDWVETSFWAFHIPEQRNDQYLIGQSLCDCVIMWVCNRFVCKTLNVSWFLCPNIFQSSPNLVRIFLGMVFFSKFQFLLFLLSFLVFAGRPTFLSKVQTTSELNFFDFYGVNDIF